MLSRGGGAVAFQKVVSKVSDLPSPLDAEPGMRIIVRETEEVYGLNSDTRMWEVIGTLKKVGGKKPEELAAHVDALGNPHKTSLQDVLGVGSEAEITQSIVVKGKAAGSELRLLDRGALRYGPSAGDGDGLLWLNAGQGKKTFLRVVDGDGNDQLVLGSTGLVSTGSATFHGGFKGAAHFEDEITAAEGLYGADGFDLVLGGDKGVLLKVAGKEKALLTGEGLKLDGDLSLRNLALKGEVEGDLLPAKKGARLGAPQARWSGALSDLDVDGQLVVRVGANSQKPPLQVTGPVPGAGVILTAEGELGLGTDKPTARLDVRGEALFDSNLRLNRSGLSCGDWSTSYGDHLVISHKGKMVFKGGPEGVSLPGGAKVEGDLVVTGKLALGGVSGLADEAIEFRGGKVVYKASDHLFTGALKVDTSGPRPLDVPGLVVDQGNAHVQGTVHADMAALKSGLSVGRTSLKDGKLASSGDLDVDAPTLVTKNLRLLGATIEVANTLKLQGSAGSATFTMGEPNCGLDLDGKSWELLGLSKLEVGRVNADALNVDGDASLCGGKARFGAKGAAITGDLNISGLAFKKVTEEVEFNGRSAQTKFKLPAGVRVEAVLAKLKSDVVGARFLQLGDDRDPSRFSGPSTDLKGGTLIRGLSHWETGRVVQRMESPVFLTADAPSTGRVEITVHFVDPASL